MPAMSAAERAWTEPQRAPSRAASREGVVRVDEAAEVEQAEHQQEHQWEHEAELDQGLAPAPPPPRSQQRAHQLSTVMLVVRQERLSPLVTDWIATL